MNILIGNTQEFNPQIGGVEKVSTTLAEKFTEMGHTVLFIACIKSKYSKPYTPVVEQIILPDEKCDSDLNKRLLNSTCINREIDIILNQAGNIIEFTRLCSFISKELHIPLISEIHINPMNRISSIRDYKFSSINRYSYLKAIGRMLLMPLRYRSILKQEKILYREVCNLSDKVVLLSKEYLKELNFITGYDNSHKVVAIANPNSSFLNEIFYSKENVILFVGRLDFDHKRPDRLICIWENLYKDFPEWKLKLAGDGPYRQQLKDYVQRKKIRNVEFLGFCDTNKQYAQASILCSTSTIEGLPMVLIEGISYGCIPISFDSYKSVYDIIEDSKTGYIIRSYKLKEYEKKMRLLMADSVLRKKMSKHALEYSHKFGISPISLQWISLFNELTEGVNNG